MDFVFSTPLSLRDSERVEEEEEVSSESFWIHLCPILDTWYVSFWIRLCPILDTCLLSLYINTDFMLSLCNRLVFTNPSRISFAIDLLI